ncbi:MAG: hypothetical protein V1645_04490 [archaeon]
MASFENIGVHGHGRRWPRRFHRDGCYSTFTHIDCSLPACSRF